MKILVKISLLSLSVFSLYGEAYANSCNCNVEYTSVTTFEEKNAAVKALIGNKEHIASAKSDRGCIKRIRAKISRKSDVIKQCKVIKFNAGCYPDFMMEYKFDCGKQRAKDATKFFTSVTSGVNYLQEPLQLEDQVAAVDCDKAEKAQDQENNPNVIKQKAQKMRLTFSSLDKIKEDLLPFIPGKILDRSKDKVGLKLVLENDNPGLGLLGGMLGDGDDYGSTHGYLLEISKGVGNDYHVTISLSSHLYTQKVSHAEAGKLKGEKGKKKPAPKPGKTLPGKGISAYGHSGHVGIVDNKGGYTPVVNENGRELVPIKFLEENLYKVMIDNKDAPQSEYFRAGIGWHELNEEAPGGFLSAANQQKQWHKVLNKHVTDNGTREYDYISSGKGKRKGFYTEGAIGTEGNLYVGESTRISGNVEGGVALTTVDPEANRVWGKATVNLDLQPEDSSIAYRAQIENTTTYYYRAPEPINATKVSIQIGAESFGCGMGFTFKSSANGPNYVKYDRDGDNISEVFCQSKF